MPELIAFIDTSEVRAGMLEDLKTAIKGLVEFVEKNEPTTIAYHVHFNEDENRMTVFQLHPDSASMEFHMTAAAHLFPGFKDLIKLVSMDIYGRPSTALLKQMQQKARLLGIAAVEVHELHAGFSRLGAS